MAYGLVQSSYFQPLEKTFLSPWTIFCFLVGTSCLLPSLCNKEDHCGIEKIVEVKGWHVCLIPLPTLGISGRDSCKAGRFVTAQIWYPKIWAKFSLFALHCIMTYIFKLLIKYFKQWKTLKGSKHSQYSHTKCICSTCQTKYSWDYIFVQEVPTTTNIIVAKFNAIAKANI